MLAIYDSGIGGASVLLALRAIAPTVDILYLADQARCPYGQRSHADIAAIAHGCARWLIGRGAAPVVVACNTASAAALQSLRAQHPETPFVGMVPAVKPAAQQTRSGVVGVMATAATLDGALYAEVTRTHAHGVRVVGQACHGLVEYVEAGDTTSPAAVAAVAAHVEPLLQAGTDTIVLGCTHYPFLRTAIEAAAPGVTLIDPAPAVALQAIRAATAHGDSLDESGQTHYVTTGDATHLRWLIGALGLPPGSVSAVTVEELT